MTEAQRMRMAGFTESLRVRGPGCEIVGSGARFFALFQPIEPADGLDRDSAEAIRVHIPTDSMPSEGIRVGTVFRCEDGRRFRVFSLAPSDSANVAAFNCEVTQAAEVVP